MSPCARALHIYSIQRPDAKAAPASAASTARSCAGSLVTRAHDVGCWVGSQEAVASAGEAAQHAVEQPQQRGGEVRVCAACAREGSAESDLALVFAF